MSKIALVHDQLTQYGGAERVLEVLHEMYPEAPIYTTVYLKDKLPDFYREWDIRTSFIDKLPIIRDSHILRAPLFPAGVQSLDLSVYDLIISDTQGIAKGIKTNKNQIHISYIHTIPWFIWGLKKVKGRKVSKWIGKRWDYKTAQNPNILIANSETTKNRIRTFYGRDAELIYPPVEINKLKDFTKGITEKEDFVLFVGRLEGYKGEMEIARACAELKQKLIIIGNGKNEELLMNYSSFVELKTNVSDEQKAKYIKKAKMLFNGSVEDFGINMVESLALGTPVLALGKGGATEIIQDKKTGLLIDNLETVCIKAGIQEMGKLAIDNQYLMNSVEKFDRRVFMENIEKIVSGYNK